MITQEKENIENMQTYRTSEIAAIIGIHPNTVRFYEAQALLPPIPRTEKGYRIFSRKHLRQLQFIRLALKAEILSGNLRNEAIEIVKITASGNHQDSVKKIALYQQHLQEEIIKAKEAIKLTNGIINGETWPYENTSVLGRREAAAQLGVSIDVLRDWERNGLIEIPRKGTRPKYGAGEMNKLKIIAILRNANYSQMAIRRMLIKISQGETDLLSAIDTPDETEDIISVADRYITSLMGALKDTTKMLRLLEDMKE